MVAFFPLSFVLHFISLWSQVGSLHYEGIPIYVLKKNEAAPASCHSEDRTICTASTTFDHYNINTWFYLDLLHQRSSHCVVLFVKSMSLWALGFCICWCPPKAYVRHIYKLKVPKGQKFYWMFYGLIYLYLVFNILYLTYEYLKNKNIRS